MSMRWAATLVAVILASAASAQVAPTTRPAANQPTTRPAVDAKLELLITQLSAEAWQTRQKAQDALVEYGMDVRPRLHALLRETRDEEVRTRVEAALRQIEQNR